MRHRAHTVPCCDACGEAIAGLGRYCSGCGGAVSTELHCKYAKHLQLLHRLGVQTLASPAADHHGPSENAQLSAPPTQVNAQQYEGERGVFLPREVPKKSDVPRVERPRPPAHRPPPPYKPSEGPMLCSTPLKSTQFATSDLLEDLCKPNKVRFKSLGGAEFTDPQTGRNVRLQGKASEKRIKLTADGPKVTEVLLRLNFHFQPPAISTPSRLYFRLPYEEEERAVVVAKLFSLAASCGVAHNIPPPPAHREALQPAGAKQWLVPRWRVLVPKEKLEGIVKRLHDDSFTHQQKETEELARKYATSPPKSKQGLKLQDINERLYYTQVANKQAQKEKIDSELAALPFSKTTQLDTETIQASTARLYSESIERDSARRQELTSKYLPSPPKVHLSSPEAMKEQVHRLYDMPKERQVVIRQQLYDRYLAPGELKSKKLTCKEIGESVGRLAHKA